MSLRKDALTICKAALRAADPEEALLRHVRVADGVLTAGGGRYRLDKIRNVFVVGAGKACAPMAKAVEKLLGKRITASCVIVKDGHALPLKRVQLRESAHPVPDQRGVDAAAEVLALATRAEADDLVICLISGGASALIALGNTLEAVTGAWLVQRYAGGAAVFDSPRTIFRFTCLAAAAATP
jgi:hydroxypyruvate reductase